MGVDRKFRIRIFIYSSFSDIIRTIRERFAMRLAKIFFFFFFFFFPRKIYRRSSLLYVFFSKGLIKNRNRR